MKSAVQAYGRPVGVRSGEAELPPGRCTALPRDGGREAAVDGGLGDAEAGRQRTLGAPADQHVDDRREQRLVRRVLRPTALRPHPVRRDQRLRDLPQPVRNNPTPRTPPHAPTNEPHHIGHGLRIGRLRTVPRQNVGLRTRAPVAVLLPRRGRSPGYANRWACPLPRPPSDAPTNPLAASSCARPPRGRSTTALPLGSPLTIRYPRPDTSASSTAVGRPTFTGHHRAAGPARDAGHPGGGCGGRFPPGALGSPGGQRSTCDARPSTVSAVPAVPVIEPGPCRSLRSPRAAGGRTGSRPGGGPFRGRVRPRHGRWQGLPWRCPSRPCTRCRG